MLKRIPSEYFRNEEIKTAFSVVFEHSQNVLNNRDVYAAYLKRKSNEDFLNEIERGEASWYDFVVAIQSEQIRFGWISPSAVANYMEAIANEKMLKRIPSEYFRNEGIKTAFSAVFEHSQNVLNNCTGQQLLDTE
jgi:hypothetical protein